MMSHNLLGLSLSPPSEAKLYILEVSFFAIKLVGNKF